MPENIRRRRTIPGEYSNHTFERFCQGHTTVENLSLQR